MSCRWVRYALFLGLLSCGLLGCRSGGSNSRYYMLNVVRETGPSRPRSVPVLAVPRFTIDTAYSNRELVYRLGPSQYESDAYNEFLVPPALMLTEKTRDWLDACGLFGQVLGVGSSLQPTHRFEANVTALYGDFRDRKAPKAVIELRVFVLEIQDGADPKPIFGKTYRAAAVPENRNPDSLIAGLNRSLQTILIDLEKDLAAAF